MLEFFSRLFYRKREIGSDEYARLMRLRQTNMSDVWLAERKRDQAITVIKIARVDEPRYVRANQRAIRNEAAYLASFQGDLRVVQMYHAAETDLQGAPRFLAVEYLKGGTLDELLQQPTGLGQFNQFLVRLTRLWRFKWKLPKTVPNALKWLGVRDQQLVYAPLPVEQAVQLFHDIAAALAAVHSAGVVHRDIKPDNIMFRKRPRSGYLYAPENLVLIDFGVATRRDRLSGIAIARGWSEPRLIRARDAGEKLIVKSGFDIYCLGKILRYLLTGERPTEQNEAKFREPLEPEQLRFYSRLSHQKQRDVAAALSGLVRRCMADDPDLRPKAEILVAEAVAVQQELQRLPAPGRRGSMIATTAAITLVALLLALNLMGLGADSRMPLFSFIPNVFAQATDQSVTLSTAVALADLSTATTQETLILPPEIASPATVTPAPTEIVQPTEAEIETEIETETVATVGPPVAIEETPTSAGAPPTRAIELPARVTPIRATPIRATPTRNPTPTVTPTVAASSTLLTPRSATVQQRGVVPAICENQGTVIASPANGQRVSGVIDIWGTARYDTMVSYKIEFALGSRAAGDYLKWSYHSEGNSAVTDGRLARFDTRPLQNGAWTLRLVVPDAQGNYPSPDPCEIMIEINN